jgi:hypothetical protein
MSAVTTGAPARVRAFPARAADHADRDRGPKRSRLWILIEALAYAGASFDPTAALAAQRFARLRDQELREGRW